MVFVPFVVEASTGRKIPVRFLPMTPEDARATEGQSGQPWQSPWTSPYIADPRYMKYAVKTEAEELIALAAYEVIESFIAIHIVYLESQPESNPTMTQTKKYAGIGKVLIAYGIKLSIDHGFGGAVFFQAKTPELEKHYVADFGAQYLPSAGFSGAPRLIIEGEAAKRVFTSFLEEE